MELNLAVSSVRITSCREQPPSVEGVQLRETRSSYFLNIKLQGLKKEDIQLEMDKERCVVIRGERCSQDMGMLRWKWRVVESGSPSKAFKIPEDVNVGGIRASFEQGLLHLSMPKLTHNRFTPYHIFHIHSSHHPPLAHRPHQPHKQQDADNMADKLATISEDADMEIEPLSPGHPEEEEEGGKMSAGLPAKECASSNSVPSVDDSMKKEVCVSQQEDVMQEKRGDVEEKIGKGIEAEETAGASSLKMNSAPDSKAKREPLLQEEKEEKEKKGNYERVKEERAIGNGYMESELSEHPKPFLCKGLSHIFSAIALIARRKLQH
ncbi:uncharacterized protein LOC131078384 [Cryptomeria japonica]|uniref:uncharacterized protein LOC131078384 n=1 Tax=Cryptomeria japonica TaxID=3369 RepID=UPI0027DA124D|nr:uncharacterized protein LOC131078384 [Cryptomeria japonica]